MGIFQAGQPQPSWAALPGWATVPRIPRLRAAATALAVIAVVLIPLSRHAAGTADADALALVGASLAATLLFAAAWLNVIVWRLTGDARSVYLAAAALSLAAVPVALGVVVPGLTDYAMLDRTRPAVALAGIPALAVLAAAARTSARLTVRSVRFMIGVVAMLTAALAVALAVPSSAAWPSRTGSRCRWPGPAPL